MLRQCYADRGFFVEIESTFAAENRAVREKRKRFYERCGLAAMGTEADVFGVRMELLGSGCTLDFEDYRAFYREYYSPRAAEHIRPIMEGKHELES